MTMLSEGLPDITSLLIFAIVSLVLFSIKSWLQSPDLSHIPTVGYSNPILSYITGVQFIFHADKLVKEGYKKYKGGLFKVATLGHWEVIATSPRAMDEIRQAPDNILSFIDYMNRLVQSEYTIGHAVAYDPYHVGIIRNQLTKNLGVMFASVREEIAQAFEENLALVGHEWTSVPALETMMKIICRSTNRACVGLPFCRNEDYLKIQAEFTVEVVKAGMIINMFPDSLKPLAGRLLTNVPSYIDRATKHVGPIVEERRLRMKEAKEVGEEWDEKPNDVLSWVMDEAPENGQDVRSITLRILTVNFAAVHTTTNSLTFALYRLAANPQYAEVLREELRSVMEEGQDSGSKSEPSKFGWTKATMQRLYRMDSFLKECQRVDGLGIVTITRVARQPFTFSSPVYPASPVDGLTLPKGTILSSAAQAIHMDPEVYLDPEVFDPWRFSRMRETAMGYNVSITMGKKDEQGKESGEESEEEVRWQLVNTTLEYLPFGYGKHSCPGRFFAANEMKIVLAHIVSEYDLKLDQDYLTKRNGNNSKGEYPQNFHLGPFLVPGKARLMFRRKEQGD